MFKANKVSCDFLFLRMCQEGIAAGQIHPLVGNGSAPAAPPGALDSLPRPVAGMLFHAGKGVKNSAFPNIRVAG